MCISKFCNMYLDHLLTLINESIDAKNFISLYFINICTMMYQPIIRRISRRNLILLLNSIASIKIRHTIEHSSTLTRFIDIGKLTCKIYFLFRESRERIHRTL